MKFHLMKTASAVAQALACFSVASCGGGNGGGVDQVASSVAGGISSGTEERVDAKAATGLALNLGFNLKSDAGGVQVPYTVGQALKQGDVPSGSSVVSDSGAMQFVVKNR